MITEQDLQAAIAECKGKRNPDSNTCVKLAAYLIIYDHMFKKQDEVKDSNLYSFSNEPESINLNSDTEFAHMVNGRNVNKVLSIVDELMDTLYVLNPRLYHSVMQKLEEIV